MPMRAIRCVATPPMGEPRNRISPATGLWKPMIERNVVVLPAPLRPTSTTSSPVPTSREMPRRMRLGWMSTGSLSSASMALGGADMARSHLAHQRGDDLVVVEDVAGRAIGEHAPALERHDPARILRDEVHVVLDQDDRLHARALGCLHERAHDAVLVRAGD